MIGAQLVALAVAIASALGSVAAIIHSLQTRKQVAAVQVTRPRTDYLAGNGRQATDNKEVK